VRNSPVAEIFGYLVCLIAVVVFLASVAGIVNNAFRVANPTPGPRLFVARMLPGHGPRGGNFFYKAGSGQRSGEGPGPMGAGPIALPNPPDATAMRARAEGNARFDAARRLVLAIVMLVVSALVFRRAFDWLNPRQGSTA